MKTTIAEWILIVLSGIFICTMFQLTVVAMGTLDAVLCWCMSLAITLFLKKYPLEARCSDCDTKNARGRAHFCTRNRRINL